MTEHLRPKDQLVLQSIQEGRDDVQKITAETTLENHHVTYCFEKLEDLGLIHVDRPDEMVERVIDGQKRVFQHPKTADLTQKGQQTLNELGGKNFDEYEDLTQRELVQKVHDLELRVDDLERKFEVFRNQVQQRLE